MKKILLSLFLVWHMQGFKSLDSLGKGLQEIQRTNHIVQMDIKQMDAYPYGSGSENTMVFGKDAGPGQRHEVFYLLMWAEEGQ
ncbi:MAG TPA: hypothetical protein VHE12_05715 [bacterium]|nr:hypothetical protein [bacterium]